MTMMREPITIHHVQLHNRLVMPPMATGNTPDGTVNQRLLDYYHEKSLGGYVGMIITEHSYVDQQGIAHAGQVSIARDSDVAGLKQLTDTIHANGVKVVAQISHAGGAADSKTTGMQPISASAVRHKGKGSVLPEAMSQAQIDHVVHAFAEAARRAKEAGFDGVEIHAAHGYLLNQFYSPLTNKREDAYGYATMAGRLKLHQEVIAAVRAEVGADWLVGLRLGGCDYQEGGATVADSVEAAVLLESYGIDFLDVTGGMNGYTVKGKKEAGYFADMTAAIKPKVSIPVILTGGVTKIEEAEALLEAGKADLIGVGRAMLKDSLWAKKAMA